MPELPEVETVRRSVEAKIRNKRIRTAEVRNDDVLDSITPEDFCALLRENTVVKM